MRYALVNPNLGHPLMLTIDSRCNTSQFGASLLFVSNIEKSKELEELLQNNLYLVPILEYKWKLRQLIEKKRRERELQQQKKEIEEKKNERRFLGIFRRKKKLKDIKFNTIPTAEEYNQIKEEIDHLFAEEQALKRLKSRVFRGEPLEISVVEVMPAEIVGLNSIKFLEDEYCSPQDYLFKYSSFQNLKYYFRAKVKFSVSEEVLEFLKRRTFVMFDIVQKSVEKESNSKNSKNRINFHSIVISKQDWKDFKFIHATDLHLAQRNDEIYGLIKNWSKFFLNTLKIKNLQEQKKKIFRGEKPLKNAWENLLPLKKRFINPNNQFRAFIKIVNKKVSENDVDFVAITGDLVDFSYLPEIPKEIINLFEFNYDQTNWKTFKEITLNQNQKRKLGVIPGEELLCPIFTIPGNHDYRPYHYDLRWAGLYRKMGLKLDEALALNDKMLALPVTAITKTQKSLKAYWEEINPSLDFSLKLGKNNFIFLNTGSDAFKNFRDLLAGHPSLTGLTIKQVKYLENIINYKIKEGDNNFVLLHGPPINPKEKRNIIKRLEKKMGKIKKTHIDEFRESLLKDLGKKEEKTRIDRKFTMKFGTVSANWEKLIKFCKEYSVLTLAGHTHDLKEFRLQDPNGKTTKVFVAPPFSLKRIENPAAVFYDFYSEMYTNARDIEKHGPFVVQTPALGIGSFKNTRLAGAFREIVVKNEKLTSFKVHYINE